MIPVHLSVACPVAGACAGALPYAGGAAAQAAASAVLGNFTAELSQAAAWLVGHVISFVNGSVPLQLDSSWFVAKESAMLSLVELVVLPVLGAATISAVCRQDLKRLARVWGVGLPVALLAGVGLVALVSVAVNVTDAMCQFIAGRDSAAMAGQFNDSAVAGLASGAPAMVEMVVSVLLILGAVLIWLELILRSAAVYIAMFFMPLALVCYIWPATATLAKRTVELLAVLVLSKFVIVASLTLGLGALEAAPTADHALISSAILLMAGFTPFSLLKLAPIVEANAIAHMEGLSRRPWRAGARAATATVTAPSHPVAGLILARARGSTAPPAVASVVAQPLAERKPDYPTRSDEGTEDG
jgi:hypothetical protein